MYNIKKLNAISGVIYDYLPKDNYKVSSHLEEGDVDAYVVRSASCHDLELNDRILAFARAGAGVNNIPIDKCTEKGVAVFNTPGANANAVKEMVLCAMLMASRNVVDAVEWVKTLQGQENIGKLVEAGKKQFVGPEIMGKTLGVIGLGAIGVMVANSAVALGMNVIGYDPFISIESAWHLDTSVHRAKQLDDLLSKSDYITVHIPLMEKTRDFISGHEFAKMKEGVMLLNFARNGIVKNSSLFEAIESGKVTKYIIDFPDDQVMGHKNVLVIPHLGASTPESEENCAVMAAKQLRNFLENGSIVNSVNLPRCELSAPVLKRITVVHKNLPNMVGQVTTAIANAGINIEEMVNKSKGDIAYSVFDLCNPAPENVIEQIKAIDGIVKVRVIN